MGTYTVLLLVGVGVIVVVRVVTAVDTKRRRREMAASATYMQPDFRPSQTVMSPDGRTGIAVDEGRVKVGLLEHRPEGPRSRIVSHRDLVAVEVVEDGSSVTTTKRSSQLGGALLGGLAFGGAGAIVGGLGAKTTSTGKVRRVSLRLTVNDTARPVHEVRLLDLASDVEKTNILYETAIQRARHWHGLLGVLIKRADTEDRAAGAPAGGSGSVADEIAKLAALRDAGALTTEEFERGKRRLLDG